jgi:hypothetical protein
VIIIDHEKHNVDIRGRAKNSHQAKFERNKKAERALANVL